MHSSQWFSPEALFSCSGECSLLYRTFYFNMIPFPALVESLSENPHQCLHCTLKYFYLFSCSSFKVQIFKSLVHFERFSICRHGDKRDYFSSWFSVRVDLWLPLSFVPLFLSWNASTLCSCDYTLLPLYVASFKCLLECWLCDYELPWSVHILQCHQT